MIRIVLIFLMSLAFVHAEAAIYKYVDKEGLVHYVDKPVEGAQPVELPELQSYVPPPAPSATDQNTQDEPAPERKSSSTKPKEALTPNYTLAITSPEAEETIRQTQQIPVHISVNPGLRETDKVAIFLDGILASDYQQSTSFLLSEVDRGSHTIKAVIQDVDNRVIASSETVTFYLHQSHQ